MARTDRLFRLLHLMRTLPAPVTAARLAEETEVSERAIYRDIASLRAAGARIDGEAGYGYALEEDPALPPQSFTRIEIEALVIGLTEAQNSGDSEIAEAAQKALAKVIATLPERQQREAAHAVHHVFRYDRRKVPARDLAVIRAACWDEAALALSYRDEAGNATQRIVLPLTILYAEKVLVLLAWCKLRQDWRSFRIDRIESAARTGESFRPRRVGLLNDYITRMKARKRAG